MAEVVERYETEKEKGGEAVQELLEAMLTHEEIKNALKNQAYILRKVYLLQQTDLPTKTSNCLLPI